MLTDARNPMNREDRSNEVWLDVDAQRAAAAYAKGAADIESAMPDIERAAHAHYGTRTAPGPGWFGAGGRLLVSSHISHATYRAHVCRRMARILSAGTGAARMPASEVSAWMALEDGTALTGLLNPTR